jgi:glycosyltransferase involved in cell wall biosynthesis
MFPLNVMVLGLRAFPNVQGGIEKHAEHLYPRIANLGCEVDVIGRAGYRSAASEIDRIRFHWLWAPKVRGLEAFAHSLLGVLYAAVERPDVLHIHAIGPGLAAPLARMLGLRVVLTHHGPDYEREKWGRVAKWVLRLGERCGVMAAHERIVITETIRRHVREKYGRESVVIPNGVDMPDPATSKSALQRYGLEPGRYILNVGRLVPEKRQLDLLAAFHRASLPGWKLVLVGGTEFPDAYSAEVEAAGKRHADVVCTGVLSGTPLRELYSHAGLFVLPSSYEGLPIAMLEALSYDIPVIASDIPATREVGLPDENYVRLGDTEQLASRIRHFVLERDGCRNHGRAHVLERYDWDRIAAETYAVYARVRDR